MINNSLLHAGCPLILPVVEHTHLEGSEQASSEARFAMGMAQRIERACSVTIKEPVSRRELPACLDNLLRQHVHQLILLPWCLQGSTAELMASAASALRQKGLVSTWTMRRPLVHVHGASSKGPLGGFISVQGQLDQYIAQLPGWHTMYTLLQAKQAAILVPQTAQVHMQFKQAKDIALLEMALFFELYPDQPPGRSYRLDAALLKDAEIYTGYLVQLLCSAIDSTFPPSLRSLPEGASSPSWRWK
jgi:hypothetical protein